MLIKDKFDKTLPEALQASVRNQSGRFAELKLYSSEQQCD